MLGADATRRRNRTALDPPGDELDEPTGLLARRCEGPEASPAPGPLRLRPRCERDSERYLSALREWFSLSLPDAESEPDFQLLLLSAGLDVPLPPPPPTCAPK